MISIIIPTYNENDHLAAFVQHLFETLGRYHIPSEVIIVDDNSPDGSGETAYYLRKHFPNLRTLHREHRHGSSTAILAGIRAAKGTVIGIMSAKMGYPPAMIPQLLKPIQAGNMDITVASRFVPESALPGYPFWDKWRARCQAWLLRPVTAVRDPMSNGFFFRRTVLDKTVLRGNFPRILPELLVKGHFRAVQEIPFHYHYYPKTHPDSGFLLPSPGFVWHLIQLYKAHFWS